jgi:hypothetical protein
MLTFMVALAHGASGDGRATQHSALPSRYVRQALLTK